MAAYIPPPAGQLDASTDEAIAAWTAALAAPDLWLESRLSTVDGLAAIAASQFPGVPSADLGRILASAALALGSICGASKKAGVPLAPWDLATILGLAAARLVAAGGEIAAMQQGGG